MSSKEKTQSKTDSKKTQSKTDSKQTQSKSDSKQTQSKTDSKQTQSKSDSKQSSVRSISTDSQKETQCVVCRWRDRQGIGSTDELIRPCRCRRKDHLYYHYQCLAELVIKTMDTPCKGCDHHFQDKRIVRNPNKYGQYLRRSMAAIAMAVVLAIIWISYIAFQSYQLYRSYQTLCHIHNPSRPLYVSTVTLLFALLTTVCGFSIVKGYNVWFKDQDKIIHFHRWQATNKTFVFNVSEAKRQYAKKHK